MQRDWFIFYRSFYEAIEKLPKENQLEAYKVLATYAIEWEEIKIESKLVEIIFGLMKPQLDANNKKASDWAKWWRPKKQKKPVVSENKTSGYENKKPNNKDKDKYKEKDNENEKENVQEIIDWFSISQKIKELVIQFVEHRREMKKEMTQRALTIFLNKIKVLDENVAAAAIERAILNKRQDIYPDKEIWYIPQKPPPMKPATREEIERRFY